MRLFSKANFICLNLDIGLGPLGLDDQVTMSQVVCNQTISFSLEHDPEDLWLHVASKSQDGTQRNGSFSVSQMPGLREKVMEGYHLHERALLYRHGTAFLLLHSSATKTPDTHYVLCVDIRHELPLGLLAAAELQPAGRVESVEVFSADFSKDRRHLAIAVGVVTGRSYMYMSETGHCFVVLYDVATWTKQMRIQTGSFVTPSVAFDPGSPAEAPRMTVVHSDGFEKPTMTTYDVNTGAIVTRSVFGAIELDGDTTTQVVYTSDGCFLLLLALEDMWHDKTSLCRVFAIRAGCLTLFHRYPASVVRPCHPDCVFTVMPVLQNCGTKFVVHGTRIDHRYEEQTYNVPCPMGLKAMCRMAVLRHLPLGPRSASGLPLPEELRNYVAFKY